MNPFQMCGRKIVKTHARKNVRRDVYGSFLRDHIMISYIRMIYTFVYTHIIFFIYTTLLIKYHITSCDIKPYYPVKPHPMISFHLISSHVISRHYIGIISYWHHITSQSHQIGRYGSSQTASSHISHHVITSHLIPSHRITLWWHHIIMTSHHYLTSFHTSSHLLWHRIIWHYIWHYIISSHVVM